MSYPILYEATETDFRTMGISVLVDAVSLLVTEERNGRFELTMEYPVDSEQFKELKNDRIIKADASPELLDQRFKIIRITKPIRGLVTIYAEHISYLSRDLALKPSVNYSGSAQIALNTWSNNIVDEHPFEVYSDIFLDKSGSWTIDKVENARKALGGAPGSILDSYGGEYQFDNYTIRLFQNRGVDNGALIAYGKNLTDLTQEEEIDSTYTSVYPYSILTDDDGNSTVITLPEYFIDSENVANFARRKILVVNFTDEEITDVDTLRNRTISYISQNGIGLPKVNLKVSFIDLSKTLDHKNMAAIENIGLCDWVTIYFEKYDIYKKSKVIKTVYNPLIEQYDSIEIGETRASLTQTIESNIGNQIKPVRDQLAIVQLQANGKNKTYTQTAEPNNYEDYLVGDSWVRPIGENDREFYTWDGTNWQFLLSTLKTREAEQAIAQQQAALEEVKTTADYSRDQLQQTIANSGFTDLDTAFGNVQTLSEQAESNAQAALSSASNAVGLAEDASSLAATLSGQVSDFELTVNGFNQTLNNYTDQVAQFTSDVNGLNSTVASYETQVDEFGNTVGTYATQVSQFENTVSGLNSTVSSYQTEVDGYSAQVSTFENTLNGLNSTVSNYRTDVQGYESQVSTLTNTVSGFNATVQRVEDDYNGLSGTVQTLGASIGVVEGQITNRVWQTDIQGAIDGIEVGGRNLYPNTTNEWTEKTFAGWQKYLHTIPIGDDENLRAGDEITWSGIINPDTQPTGIMAHFITDTGGYIQIRSNLISGGNVEKAVGHTVVPSNAVRLQLALRHEAGDVPSDTVRYKELKIERGNKATDWTPAPEDTTELISSIQTEWTQTFEEFETSVTGSDGRLTLAEQFIDGFRNTAFDPSTGQLSLTEQTINGLQDIVSDPVNGLETRVTTIADGFQVLSTDFNNLQIGGRNLYPNTTNEWTEKTFAGWQKYLHTIPIGDDENLRAGDEITWSGIINPDTQPTGIMAHFITDTGGYIQIRSNLISGGNVEKAVGHTVVPSNAVRLQLALRHEAGDVPSDTVRYKELKIERGNKATDWTPAPEDMASQAQLAVTNENVLARVEKGDVYSQLLIDSRNILFDANDRFMISANKVVIDASEGTFITSAIIESLSADKITAGTIDASEINVINLNVSRLVGNKGNFVSLALSDLNSNLTVTGSKLEYAHSDGSKTIMSASGLYHSEGGSNYKTNYLFDVITVTGLNHSGSVKWVNLPTIYKGKAFKAHAVVADTYGVTQTSSYFNLAMLRVVCFVDTIDHKNGRVGLRGYSFHRDVRNNRTYRKSIQCKLIVTY
uniref:phage tail spike protein n=1 Tax=Aerococcus urinaeequi TaxID=51665 RepID=UPI00352AA570